MNLIEKINLLERVHNLIRRKATGDPKSLAFRLQVSERTVFNIIKVMKEMDAPIYFCRNKNSFCYERDVNFSIGFTSSAETISEARGGSSSNLFREFFRLQNFCNRHAYI